VKKDPAGSAPPENLIYHYAEHVGGSKFKKGFLLVKHTKKEKIYRYPFDTK